MTPKSSLNLLSIEEYKALLSKDSSIENLYFKTGHSKPENELLLRPIWFKGSRDRGLRENIAA